MNRRSFIKGLFGGAPLIIIPKVTKPYWGKPKKIICETEMILYPFDDTDLGKALVPENFEKMLVETCFNLDEIKKFPGVQDVKLCQPYHKEIHVVRQGSVSGYITEMNGNQITKLDLRSFSFAPVPDHVMLKHNEIKIKGV
jgi:hypothetical protein